MSDTLYGASDPSLLVRHTKSDYNYANGGTKGVALKKRNGDTTVSASCKPNECRLESVANENVVWFPHD